MKFEFDKLLKFYKLEIVHRGEQFFYFYSYSFLEEKNVSLFARISNKMNKCNQIIIFSDLLEFLFLHPQFFVNHKRRNQKFNESMEN